MDKEIYPRGWMRIEVFADRAVVMFDPSQCRIDPRTLTRRVQIVLDLPAVRAGKTGGGHVPPSFVYHLSQSGHVFNARGALRCNNPNGGPLLVQTEAQACRAAKAEMPTSVRVVVLELPIVRDADGRLRARPEVARRIAAIELGLSPVKATVAKPREAELVDGLTPMQCYDAFCAA